MAFHSAHSCDCWAQRSINANAAIWILESYAKSAFNRHPNDVNNADVNHSRKVRSLTSFFFFFSFLFSERFACFCAIMSYPYFFFFFLPFHCSAINVARQLCAQILKTVWPELIHFPWVGLSVSFSCKKYIQNVLFRVCVVLNINLWSDSTWKRNVVFLN